MALSKQLKNKGGLFVLDGKDFFPHITLYMLELPLDNLQKVREFLRKFVSETNSFPITAIKYRNGEGGYIDVDFERNENVVNLQRKIIELINPLRQGLIRPKDMERMGSLSDLEQNNLKQYGFRSVGEGYVPHLTFSKLEKSDVSVLGSLSKFDFSFSVEKIAIYYLGEFGTCNKLIEIFDLL